MSLRPLIVGLLLLAPLAQARVPDPLPVGPGDFPPAVRAGWVWRDVFPRSLGGVADVAVLPAESSGSELAVVAAVDASGGVWVSRDAARTWNRMLTPDATEMGFSEQLRGQVDDGVRAPLEDADVDLEDADSEDFTSEDDVTGPTISVDDLAITAGTTDTVALAPRIWFTADGVLVVGRGDGLHISDDLGSTWSTALEVGATALVAGPDGWVLGTVDGIYLTDDILDWSTATHVLAGNVVHDLATDYSGVHAATEQGLYHSEEGRRWVRSGLAEPVFAVLPDVTTDRAWIAAEDGVYIGGEQGRGEIVRGNETPKGLLSLALLGDDHVVGAGKSGPWESTDGGQTWAPIDAGLVDRGADSLVVVDGVMWLAASDGLFRLEPDDGVVGTPDVAEWIDLGALIDSTMRRAGVRSEPVGNRVVAALMPKLQLDYTYRDQDRLDFRNNTTSGGTTLNTTDYWAFKAQLTWTPRASRQGGDFDPYLYVDDLGDADIFQDEDTPYLQDRTQRVGSEYAIALSSIIADLYHTRQILVGERKSLYGRPLAEKVALEIDIQETEARLDALTEGTVAAWNLDHRK